MNKWVVASVATILTLGASSCRKDTLNLSDAGKDIYITITPADPNLNLYVGDTVAMDCQVSVPDGRKVDTQISWSSEDESIAKFVDGSNRLVAVKGSEGRVVRIKATLSNGRYAVTTASVLRYKAEGMDFLLSANEYLKDKLVVARDGYVELLIVAKPAQVLAQDKITFEGVNDELFKIEPIALDPTKEADKKRIDATPKGGIWYKISAKGQDGSAKLTAKVSGSDNTKTIDLSFGSVLKGIGLNEAMNEAEHSATIDINKETEVKVYTEFAPFTDADVAKVLSGLSWKVNGSGAILTGTSHEKTATGLVLKAKLHTGATTGNFDVVCSAQGKSVRKSFEVVNVAEMPFERVVFKPTILEDLYVGELQPIQIQVLPRTSQAYLQESFQFTFSDPTVASVQSNADGTFAVKGLKAGSTELILTVRGQSFSLPITAKAAVKSVLINNNTETVVMAGDVVRWDANVQMLGSDQPTWGSLVWNSSDDKVASIETPKTGQSVSIKAAELTETKKATITANYRGTLNTRMLTVVPLQKSLSWLSTDTDIDESVITTERGMVSVQLVAKTAVGKEAITLLIQPKTGVAQVKAGVYALDNSNIYLLWNTLNLRKQVASGSTITITKSGENYNVSAQLTMQVGSKTITANVDAQGLEED